MAEEIGKSFESLPIHQLICAPILAVAEGQDALCKVYLDNILKIAFEDHKDGETAKAKVIKFTVNRMVTNADGSIKTQPVEMEAPLLSLIPVPAFTMDEATVKFTMEVKEVNTEKKNVSSEASSTVSSNWFCRANISGKVTTSADNTRTSDKSAKYEIFARAVQHPPAEGMAKLTQIFASVIEPISAGGGGGNGEKGGGEKT